MKQTFYRQRRRRGILLLEVLISLALLAIVAELATQMIIWSLRADARAARLRDQASSFDSAVARLRADVWAADKVGAAGPMAIIRRADGRSVFWRIEPDGTLVRMEEAADGRVPTPGTEANPASDPASPQAARATTEAGPPGSQASWPTVAPGLSFDAGGGSLRISMPSDRGTDRLTLPNQPALAGRGG
jgi:Tfp pilus assembly protein PilV